MSTPTALAPALAGTAGTRPSGAASDLPELTFARGLPGFPGNRRFALVRWGAEGPWSLLVDLDDPHVRFLVVPPFVFFPDYSVELDDALVARLHLQGPDECLLLLIVTVGEDVDAATANLLGPVVVNLRTREGAQVVLADSGHSTTVPLRR